MKTTIMSRNILILENDRVISDNIQAFVNQPQFDNDTFDDITGLQFKEPQEIIEKINKADAYVFSSAFSNQEQNLKIIKLLGSQTRPKEIFIYSLNNELYIKLHEILPDNFDPWRNGFAEHRIYEINILTKRDASNTNHFFKKFIYYFDVIEYYWNSDTNNFFPIRPTCFYDTNLKDIYLYKPEWKEKWFDKNERN